MSHSSCWTSQPCLFEPHDAVPLFAATSKKWRVPGVINAWR